MSTFLTAHWSNLILANYVVDPAIVKPYVPAGTSIDFFEGQTYVSLVAFMFNDTRVKGCKLPLHTNFEEANLRFYIKREEPELRRAVGFIKEIVPRRLISFVARKVYQENYVCMPMAHRVEDNNYYYSWTDQKRTHAIEATVDQAARIPEQADLEHFITEHYWGYTAATGRTTEYRVEHPQWAVSTCNTFTIDVDFATLYGDAFAFLNDASPANVCFAEGSDVKVMDKTVL